MSSSMVMLLASALVSVGALAEDPTWTAVFTNEKEESCSAQSTVTQAHFSCTINTPHGTETYTLSAGPFLLPGATMLLRTQLSFVNVDFQVPIFSYKGDHGRAPAFFAVPVDTVQSPVFNGEIDNMKNSYKFKDLDDGEYQICDTDSGTCCNTYHSACLLDSDTQLNVTKDDACNYGDLETYGFRFGKSEKSTGKSLSVCAIGDPQVYWNIASAGDDTKPVQSKIYIKVTEDSHVSQLVI